jgi:hypothetical protein
MNLIQEVEQYIAGKDEEVDTTDTKDTTSSDKPVQDKPEKKSAVSSEAKQSSAFDHISDMLANVAAILEFVGRRKNLGANGLTKNLIQDINLILNKLLKTGLNAEVSDIDAENLIKASVNVSKAKKIVDGLEKKMNDELGKP